MEPNLSYDVDNTFKYSNVRSINESIWSKLQFTYSSMATNKSTSRAYGMDTRIWFEHKKTVIYFDIVATFIDGGAVWIYFWDVNLPGEMTTLVYTKKVISPAVKIIYRPKPGFELGFRFRAQWQDFDFGGTPEMFEALALEVVL